MSSPFQRSYYTKPPRGTDRLHIDGSHLWAHTHLSTSQDTDEHFSGIFMKYYCKRVQCSDQSLTASLWMVIKGQTFSTSCGRKVKWKCNCVCVSVCVWGQVTSAFKRNVTVRGCSFKIRRIMVRIVYFFYVQYDQSDFTNMPGAEATPPRSPSFSRKSPGFEILLTTKSTAKCTWSIKSRSAHNVKCLLSLYDYRIR